MKSGLLFSFFLKQFGKVFYFQLCKWWSGQLQKKEGPGQGRQAGLEAL